MRRVRKTATALLAVAALSTIGMAGVASAHSGPEICAFTSATGLPASINNVEGKGGPWTINGTTKFWDGSGGPDGDPMTAQTAPDDGFGHGGLAGFKNGRRGLYYPVTDPNGGHRMPGSTAPVSTTVPSFVGDHFNWTNIDQCQNNSAPVNTKGVGIGYCGRSVGLGSGITGSHNVVTKWESAGSQLYLLDPSSTGTLNAQPNPPGSPDGSCLDGTAIKFNLNGVLTHQ